MEALDEYTGLFLDTEKVKFARDMHTLHKIGNLVRQDNQIHRLVTEIKSNYFVYWPLYKATNVTRSLVCTCGKLFHREIHTVRESYFVDKNPQKKETSYVTVEVNIWPIKKKG